MGSAMISGYKSKTWANLSSPTAYYPPVGRQEQNNSPQKTESPNCSNGFPYTHAPGYFQRWLHLVQQWTLCNSKAWECMSRCGVLHLGQLMLASLRLALSATIAASMHASTEYPKSRISRFNNLYTAISLTRYPWAVGTTLGLSALWWLARGLPVTCHICMWRCVC